MSNQNKNKQLDEMYESFLRQRKVYEMIHFESEKRLDILVVSLSCAAIGWFVAFHKFIDFGSSAWAGYLKFSVLFGFGLALISNLLSHYVARCNADKKIKEADRDYKKRKKLLLANKPVPNPADKNFWTNKIVVLCNGVSLIGIIFGIIGVLICVGIAETPFSRNDKFSPVKESVMSNNKQGAKNVPVCDGLTAIKKSPEMRVFHNGLTPVAKNPPKKSK